VIIVEEYLYYVLNILLIKLLFYITLRNM